MTKVQEIFKKYENRDPMNSPEMQREMRDVPEVELYFYQSFDSSGQSQNFKKQVAMVRAELDRRSHAQTRKLTTSVTIIAGLMGIVGTVLGAFLGYYLKG
tara:strand:- start:257 stop:556 length:300 start_codon:yes stop_codon:yes gene_type:complete